MKVEGPMSQGLATGIVNRFSSFVFVVNTEDILQYRLWEIKRMGYSS